MSPAHAELGWVGYTRAVKFSHTMKPAGWVASAALFGVPALVFAFLFHWLGPHLVQQGTSWWRIFHLLLILPLSLMLVAALCGAAFEVKVPGWKGLIERLRLAVPQRTVWLWAIALSGFMFGGTVADLVALVSAGLALWLERTGRIAGFAGVLAAVLVKRSAYLLQPTFAAVRFFNPALFNDAFFGHFGPHDFMGIPLHAAWWIPAYYAAIMFVCNIGGEELWWRGYVLPRQELAFGRATWIIHGILWSAFHLFMQPTLWDTLRMSITGLALSFVAQRTKSTWPGIIGHSFGNLAFFLSLVNGVRN